MVVPFHMRHPVLLIFFIFFIFIWNTLYFFVKWQFCMIFFWWHIFTGNFFSEFKKIILEYVRIFVERSSLKHNFSSSFFMKSLIKRIINKIYAVVSAFICSNNQITTGMKKNKKNYMRYKGAIYSKKVYCEDLNTLRYSRR